MSPPLNAAAASSSHPPPIFPIDQILEGVKGIERAIYDGASHLGKIIARFEMHKAEAATSMENMVATLYSCHVGFLDAFEELLATGVDNPEHLVKRVAARDALIKANEVMKAKESKEAEGSHEAAAVVEEKKEEVEKAFEEKKEE